MPHIITCSTISVPHSFCISRNRYKFTCVSYLSKQEVIVFTYVETYLVTWTKTTIDCFSYQRTKHNTAFGKQYNHFPVIVNDQGMKQRITI